jgi:hypothetical protein
MMVNILFATDAFFTSFWVIGRLDDDPLLTYGFYATGGCIWVAGVFPQFFCQLFVVDCRFRCHWMTSMETNMFSIFLK